MGMLLAFAPVIAFAAIDRLLGSTEGLLAGAIVSIVLLLRDRFRGKSPKLLEIGTTVLFGAMTLYSLLAAPQWSVMMVRLLVDSGLLLIVLVSLVVGRPFTLQYARESVPADLWASPVFLRTNTVITGEWALAFLVMVVADLVLVFASGVPQRVGIIATILALVSAIKFTGWYPDRLKAQAR